MPDGLLLEVARYLNLTDLTQFALVSRRISTVTQNVLYQHLDIHHDVGCRLKLHLLIRTFLARPDLRDMVKSLKAVTDSHPMSSRSSLNFQYREPTRPA